MSDSASDAIANYLACRAEEVTERTLQRDVGWTNYMCAALEVLGREYFEDFSGPKQTDYCELLPAQRLAEALPVLLDFATERLSDEPKDHKEYLSFLKRFFRWLAAEGTIEEKEKREVLKRLQSAEAPIKAITQQKLPKHKWAFTSKFRKGAYGWNGTAKAQAALKSALSEIQSVAKSEPGIAAEGATVLLEKLVPALEKIDSSSGAIGSSVSHALEVLAPVIGGGHAAPWHEARVQRCFDALQNDEYGYLEGLGKVFDQVCGTPTLCATWADNLYYITKNVFENPGGFFPGTSACLCLLHASGQYQRLEQLLKLRTFKFWPYDQWIARSLASQGKIDEALEFASDYPESAYFCEQLLLEHGRVEEAYEKFGLRLSESSYLNSFRAVCKRYPQLDKAKILTDLIELTPGEEGKWFAAARSLGDLELLKKLAWEGPCNPSTVTTAVKALEKKEPRVAYELACAALYGMDLGWAYELDYAKVSQARLTAERLAEQLNLQAHWENFRKSFRGFLKNRAEFQA